MSGLILLIISVLAGFLGSLLGLGGGIIVVPALTLFFGVDIRYAVAASLVSIMATSSTAATSFIKDHLANIRVAVVLELGTVAGAITGVLISSAIETKWLFVVFGGFLLFSSVLMVRNKVEVLASQGHPWAIKLNLGGVYPSTPGKIVAYEVAAVPQGLFFMYFAGILSALLGIGSGIFKVLAMDKAMRLPLKVSSATSNFMIGVTAAASAGAYFLRGDIRIDIACPVAIGIMGGSILGAKALMKMPSQLIRKIFVFAMIIVGLQMITKGFYL